MRCKPATIALACMLGVLAELLDSWFIEGSHSGYNSASNVSHSWADAGWHQEADGVGGGEVECGTGYTVLHIEFTLTAARAWLTRVHELQLESRALTAKSLDKLRRSRDRTVRRMC